MDNRQWREFMDAAMGVPPGRVTVAAVRRRLVRHRIREADSGGIPHGAAGSAVIPISTATNTPGKSIIPVPLREPDNIAITP